MSLPPWIRESTEARADEVERVAGDLDPRLVAVAREATAPSPAELARLRSRLPSPRRVWSPLWIAGPAVLALALLTARFAGPTPVAAVSGAAGDGLHAVSADHRSEIVPGVWALGRGTAEVSGGVATLDGILRIEASVPFEFAVSRVRFATDGAAFHVADGGFAVVSGVIRGADGSRLGAGESWSPVVAVIEPPAAPPIPVAGPAARPAPAPKAAAAPDPGRAAPLPPAVVAWRDLLDARDAGATGAGLARMLGSYRSRFPDSPFAEEAADLAVLEAARSSPPAEALQAVEARLAASSAPARAQELHAAAALLARESLRDCDRAAPHDAWLAAHTGGRTQATARALLGLCAAQAGRDADARAAWEGLDDGLLDPQVAAAVAAARAAGGGR